MRSKYHVEHSARVANAEKTITVHGVELAKNVSQPRAFYYTRLTDTELALWWSLNSNEAFPGYDALARKTNVRGLELLRFDHTKEPYTSVTIDADKALDLIASGAAIEGEKLQPEFAG